MERQLQLLLKFLFIITFFNIPIAQTIDAGDFHSLFTCSDGSVRTVGYNANGQLGDGTYNPRYTAVLVNGLSGIVKVSGGRDHSLFLKNDGTVWSVGSNSIGQLGDGTTIGKNIPVQITTLTNITSMDGGGIHSLFVKSDGSAWSVGSNSSGALGNGSFIDEYTPIQVTSLLGIIGVSAGLGHSIFLKNDGTVWATGENGFGQLGDGTMVNFRSTPVQVNILSGITAISAGLRHNLFLKSDGTVWSVGYNDYGQLGDGTSWSGSGPSNISYSPGQVLGLTGIIAISGGGDHSLFLKNDGTVWSVGYNFYGQLGDGTTVNKSTPVQVAGLTDIVGIAAGYRHSLFLKNDGTVWASGYGNNGALGLGFDNLQNVNTPVQITTLCNILEVEEHNVFSNSSIYPNPTSGIVNIKTKTVSNFDIKLFDTFGKEVCQFKNTDKIDLSRFTSGLYLLQLKDSETLKTVTHKIIKN